VIGISFEQLILILVLALILFGPEKLPEIAEKIGKWMAKARQASSDFTQQYQQVLNPPLPPPAAMPLPHEVFTCPHCAHTMEERFTFCPHCGQRHEEEMPLEEEEEDIFVQASELFQAKQLEEMGERFRKSREAQLACLL